MNFFGALGGIGQGVSAGIKDIRENDIAKQQQEMNELRIKQIQMGIDKDLKEQLRTEAYEKERKSFRPAQARYDAEFKAKTEEVARQNAEIQKQRDNPMPTMLRQGQSLPSVKEGYKPIDDPSLIMKQDTEPRPTIHIAPEPEIPIPELMAMPARQKAGLHDEFQDMVNLAKIDIRHGRAKAETLVPLLTTIKNIEDEGMSKSLRRLLAGDQKGAIEEFVSTGVITDASKLKFRPSTFTPSGEGRQPMNSVMVTLPDGREIDAAGALYAMDQAKDMLGAYAAQEKRDAEREKIKNEKNKNDNEDKRHTNSDNETRRHNMAEEESRRAENAAKLAKDKNESYKVEGAEVATVLGDPAVDKHGKPIIDMMTGRQSVNRNPVKEAEFYRWMAQNGIRDTNKGLAIYMGEQPEKPAAPVAKPVAVEQPTLTQKLRNWASGAAGVTGPTARGITPKAESQQDAAARAWAKANPSDPRAAKINARLQKGKQ